MVRLQVEGNQLVVSGMPVSSRLDGELPEDDRKMLAKWLVMEKDRFVALVGVLY